METALVVGTGPAGLLAGYAAHLEGCYVTFVTPPDTPRMSVIHGAQYLHRPIEGIEEMALPFTIRYRHEGTEEGYRRKIYGGSVAEGQSSWGLFKPIETAWSVRDVYQWLADFMFDKYSVVEQRVTAVDLMAVTDAYTFVLNTAPLKSLCPSGNFETETVLIIAGNNYSVPNNEIHYYGDDQFLAYRASNIQGVCSAEYPASALDLMGHIARLRAKAIMKPLRCANIEMDGVYRLGRYGKWRKGVLAHEAYEETRELIRRRLPWSASLPT